jgi:alkylated DNA repair protein alkB homolog 6
MKLSFNDIKNRLHQKPVIVRPRSFNFTNFLATELSLSDYQLEDSLWLIPDYISEELESNLLEYGVYSSPFTLLRNRRVQLYGGHVTPEGLTDRRPLPRFVEIFAQRLFDERVFPLKPNHVLINEYKPGEGIMAHADGPAYFPLVSNLSLGSDSVIQFYSRAGEPALALFLPKRSLLLFAGQWYEDMLHSIEPVREDLLYRDQCGVFAKTASGLSRVKGPVPECQEIGDESTAECPVCREKFNRAYVNYRETRVSFTLRFVPPVG